jgi:LAS superfamily LD-carboxypeptidase LdcB
MVEGWQNGLDYNMEVSEVECGHLMRVDLVPQVQSAIRAGREAGLTISISSAWRSMPQQQTLYEGWKEGRPGFNPADRPGYSNHQNGTAIDLAFASGAEREEFAALAIAHGMTRPTHELWHWVAGKLPPELVTEPPKPAT